MRDKLVVGLSTAGLLCGCAVSGAKIQDHSPPIAMQSCPIAAPALPNRSMGAPATAEELQTFLAKIKGSSFANQVEDFASTTMAQAVAGRQNVTRMSHDSKHGTQVTYSTADGRVFLWYSGNPVVLAGKWQACEGVFSMGEAMVGGQVRRHVVYGKLCFQYAPETLNPVTKTGGGRWECGPAGSLERLLIEKRNGDIFGLEKRTSVPFAMSSERTSIDKLLVMMPKKSRP